MKKHHRENKMLRLGLTMIGNQPEQSAFFIVEIKAILLLSNPGMSLPVNNWQQQQHATSYSSTTVTNSEETILLLKFMENTLS